MNRPLSNLDIENLIEKYDLENLFAGVSSKDDYEEIEKTIYFRIVNLQNEKEGNGSHWVMYFKCYSTVYYFDSYGAPPYQKLIDYCKNNGLLLLYNNKKLQDDDWSCGYWCLKEVLEIVGFI